MSEEKLLREFHQLTTYLKTTKAQGRKEILMQMRSEIHDTFCSSLSIGHYKNYCDILDRLIDEYDQIIHGNSYDEDGDEE